MNSKIKNFKLYCCLLIFVIMTLVSGCGRKEVEIEDKVNLRLFSNLTDRTVGQGAIEQQLIDEYMKANPNVCITVETLEEEAYKTKFRAYVYDGMPDIVSVWGQPAFIADVAEAGLLEEIPAELIEDYGFVDGSLNGFSLDGKLYGLPRNTDVTGFYYNKAIFEENGWSIPKNYEDFLLLCQDIRTTKYIPVAIDGEDGWPLAVFFDNLLLGLAGDKREELLKNAIIQKDFSDEAFDSALDLLLKTVEMNVFERNFESTDYGEAYNLFVSGQAAMYYSGSWDASMAVNDQIEENVRNNIDAFMMPAFTGDNDNIMAWFGGGYSVSSESPNKEVALDFIMYMFRPDKLSAYGLVSGVGLSAQNQSEYITGNETNLQKKWLKTLSDSKGTSGTPINDLGPGSFKSAFEGNIGRVAIGDISKEVFIEILEDSCR